MNEQTGSRSNQPGPDPDRLALPGEWEDRVGDALNKKRPAGGFPPPAGEGSKPRKKKGSGEKPEPEPDEKAG